MSRMTLITLGLLLALQGGVAVSAENVPATTVPIATVPAEASRLHLAPQGWEGSYHELHYTPVVKLGDRVIVSGIPSGPGTTDEEKIRWMFDKLKAHLEQAGASLEDVVELQSFHVASNHAEFRKRIEPVLKVHREFFKDHYPAWTAVATPGLYAKDAVAEMRAEAIIGSGARAKVDIPAPEPAPAK